MNHYYQLFREQTEFVIKHYEEKTAFTYLKETEEKITFGAIGRFFEQSRMLFQQVGLKPGDRVAIVAPHSPHTVFSGMALVYSGIVIVPIDATLPQESIENLIAYSDVKAILTTDVFFDSIKDKTKYVFLKCEENLDITIFNNNCAVSFDEAQTKSSDEDVIAILYSSGTTGLMKGVMVTYESVMKAKDVFVRLANLKDYMTYLLVLPFYHIAGFTGAMTYFLTGCELGFIQNVDATKLQMGLLKFQPHYFAMIPKIYEVIEQKIRSEIASRGHFLESAFDRLLRLSRFFRKHFGINIGRWLFKKITRSVFGKNIYGLGTGASPCKAETTEFFLDLGLEWANLYATTETGVPAVATGVQDRYPVGTVGNVNRHPEISVKILQPDIDGIGEVLVKSDLMMKGYFKRQDLTSAAFVNGYFKTGDLGYIDAKGYLYLTGRVKESIVLANGKKVSPLDVDEYYTEKTSGLYDLACRGLLSKENQSDEIHMFVSTASLSSKKAEDVRIELEMISNQAPQMYKLTMVHFIPEIQRTSISKIKRFCLEPADEIENIKSSAIVQNTTSEKDDLIAIFKKYCKSTDIEMDNKLIEDLGIDSLMMFSIVNDIAQTYGKDISSELDRVKTVSDVHSLISKPAEISQNKHTKARTKKSLRDLRTVIFAIKHIYDFSVSGTKHIPPQDNYFLCSNHICNLDPMFIMAAMGNDVDLQKINCLAAKHTNKGVVGKRLFNAIGGISVDREGNTVQAMNDMKQCVNHGNSVIVFPEGARSRNGNMLAFKDGTARLAMECHKNVLPVRIDGAYEIFPRHRKLPRLYDWKNHRKYRLTISFGTPISPDDFSTPNEMTAAIKNQIVQMEGTINENRN